MTNEISVFIMDVSNSSKENIGNRLSEYLQQLQLSITNWTQNILPICLVSKISDWLWIWHSKNISAL